ncbi:ADP-ribosylglycohydrolase family protein [Paraburkholderia phenazinium]|jgi:ADP-ribosylglycohydrolase|uniref:ADP-ribosylglycohydrolase n=1 Tax=Paraburkholderia phenazinium TaxID=60549 RepID=A0A1N6J0R3_9BURK|nr:ADP-ribosylglycohydrolase family protein [Paraburkholderia phenazinium]SIO37968.1 ADP-ribosylglycohydrolase [Paraburkholderia phenazinium]
MSLQQDYLERVYAGVLGKLIGVFLGRPFENWTHQRIMAELGTIDYYVHDRLGVPLVVTDDDVAGTFTFLRAFEEHGVKPELSAEEIGKTWLNNIVENRAILWWGGSGNSSEHTAWLNLKRGVPAPASGSIAVNGQTVAEQIGAQIFIDGWAMVAPGQPQLAARLAEQAAKVSHDGEAVHAAKLLAAMEAEAFVSDDVTHLIEVGLSVIPEDSLIARLIADVRRWHAELPEWRDCRQRIQDHYGYDKFPGNCHVVPNHALIIMSLLYAPDDLQKALMIVNTSGWDTDCNSGNLGCLLGIKLGLAGVDAGPDWRGPIADRMLISSADGGNAVTDAVRIAYQIAGFGHQLAGMPAPDRPKNGALFHFSLPGSVQGFEADTRSGSPGALSVENSGGKLALRIQSLAPGQKLSAMTPTFSPPNAPQMPVYELMATPLIYPGQWVEASIAAGPGNSAPVSVNLRLKVYGKGDTLNTIDGESQTLAPGQSTLLRWRLPDTGGQPIQQIGFNLATAAPQAKGVILVDYLRCDGPPELRLRRPDEPGDFWRLAWINSVSIFSKNFPAAFRISQSVGEGIIIHGTRQWSDYTVSSSIVIHLGHEGGLAVRVQGLRRYYAMLLSRDGYLRLIKVRDGKRTVLAEKAYSWNLEQSYPMSVTLSGSEIDCSIDGQPVFSISDTTEGYENGGIGLVINEGALSTAEIRVSSRPESARTS